MKWLLRNLADLDELCWGQWHKCRLTQFIAKKGFYGSWPHLVKQYIDGLFRLIL
jgi:hypothetical protein